MLRAAGSQARPRRLRQEDPRLRRDGWRAARRRRGPRLAGPESDQLDVRWIAGRHGPRGGRVRRHRT